MDYRNSHNLMTWAQQLRHYRQRAGVSKSALARELGVSASYATKLETSQKPPPESRRQLICEILGLTEEEGTYFHIQAELERADSSAAKYLVKLGELQSQSDEQSEGDRPLSADGDEFPTHVIPVINKVAAGYPQEFTDLDYPIGVADSYISVPDVVDPNAFAFYVHGDSMTPDFAEGSLLIASPNTPAFDGDPCFVRFSASSKVNGCTFKRMYSSSKGGRVRLVPINHQYPEQVYDADDISGMWPVVRQYSQIPGGKRSHGKVMHSSGRVPGRGDFRASAAG